MTRSDIADGARLTLGAFKVGLAGLELAARLGWIIASELIADWRQK